jgi:hypothetical protein
MPRGGTSGLAGGLGGPLGSSPHSAVRGRALRIPQHQADGPPSSFFFLLRPPSSSPSSSRKPRPPRRADYISPKHRLLSRIWAAVVAAPIKLYLKSIVLQGSGIYGLAKAWQLPPGSPGHPGLAGPGLVLSRPYPIKAHPFLYSPAAAAPEKKV